MYRHLKKTAGHFELRALYLFEKASLMPRFIYYDKLVIIKDRVHLSTAYYKEPRQIIFGQVTDDGQVANNLVIGKDVMLFQFLDLVQLVTSNQNVAGVKSCFVQQLRHPTKEKMEVTGLEDCKRKDFFLLFT